MERALVLTYDDGPSATFTPRLLELLAMHEARATFFLLGCRVVHAPHLADRIVACGHEIGCHSHAHLDAWRVSPWRSAADVRRGYRSLEPWLPDRALFRPPYGRTTPCTRAIARRRGSRLGGWTVDSGDTRRTPLSPDALMRRVEASRGGVVRMHDQDGDPERQALVLQATDALLELAARAGLRVMRMSELLGRSPR
jgi:peptidoglycan/xylan/chitin deacetylase (PgdA/CDA1 family)